MRYIVLLLALALAACSTTISSNPVVSELPKTGIISTQDFTDALADFDGAVAIGALPATDSAPKCLHEVADQLGLNPAAPPKAFDAKVSGVSSFGAVAYIKAQQLAAASGNIQVPADCKAIIGDVVLKGLAAAKHGAPLPGLNLLPTLQ